MRDIYKEIRTKETRAIRRYQRSEAIQFGFIVLMGWATYIMACAL